MTDGGERDGAGTPRRLPMPRTAYRELDDAALMDAMRREEDRAIEEFLVRYQRLLADRARHWHVDAATADDAIADVLADVAVQIVNGRIRPTRSLAAYLVKAYRTRVIKQWKARHQRSEAERTDAEGARSTGDRALTASVSESTLRASRGSGWEGLDDASAVIRLARLLEQELTEEEQRILGWLSSYVSQRDISSWLGVSYAAGTQRIWRLRDRLRRAALARAEQFDGSEREALAQFFRRLTKRAESPARRAGNGPQRSGDFDAGA